MHFHDFRPNREWVDGISPKMMLFKKSAKYSEMLFDDAVYKYVSYNTTQHYKMLCIDRTEQRSIFSHAWTLRKYQTDAVCRHLFSSEMCEFVHASTGDSCVCWHNHWDEQRSKRTNIFNLCIAYTIFGRNISSACMNQRSERMKISTISWIEQTKTTP